MGAPAGFRHPKVVAVALVGSSLFFGSIILTVCQGVSGASHTQMKPPSREFDSPVQWPDYPENGEEDLPTEGPWLSVPADEMGERDAPPRTSEEMPLNSFSEALGGGLDALDVLGFHSADSQPTLALAEQWEEGEGTRDSPYFPLHSTSNHNFLPPSVSEEPSNIESDDWPREGASPADGLQAVKGADKRRLAADDLSGLPALNGRLGVGWKSAGVKKVTSPPAFKDDRSASTPHSDRGTQTTRDTGPQRRVMSPVGGSGGRPDGGGNSGSHGSSTPEVPPEGKKAPHEYYLETIHAPHIKGLRWAPDPRVLQPEILRALVKDPGGIELVKEKAMWQNAYGFNKEVTVTSRMRRGSKYKLVFTDVLGSGGIGVVLSAIDVTNNRRIAVKVCRLQKKGQPYAHEILRRRAQEEITLWKYVPSFIGAHKWSQISQVVIPIDMVGPTERLPTSNDDSVKYSHEWIILEVFAGDLTSIDTIWNGNMVTKIEVTKQVIYSTMSLHAMGLVHSDIKPPNFLVHHDGRIYIGDSSLSTPVNQDTACLNGTLHYLPPENMRCEIYHKRRILTSERKDSWAVGVVLFRLFCSTLPFEMKGMWYFDVETAIGNAVTADLDFTVCHPDTPILIMGLIRLLLTPTVTLRPTLRDLYLNYPLFGMSNTAIAGGKKLRDVEAAVIEENPSFAAYALHN